MATKIKEVELDSPSRREEILRVALDSFVSSVQQCGFVPPIQVKVLDTSWRVLRTFRIEQGGEIAAGYTRKKQADCAWPLKIIATDRRARIARLRVGCNGDALEVEFIN